MRGYLIRTDGRRGFVDVGDWRGIAETLECDWVDVVRLEGGADMFIDDEGLLTDRPLNYIATVLAIEKGPIRTWLRGDVIVFGTHGDGGTEDVPEWVEKWVEELKRSIEPPEVTNATSN
jgi:hypothetical protein